MSAEFTATDREIRLLKIKRDVIGRAKRVVSRLRGAGDLEAGAVEPVGHADPSASKPSAPRTSAATRTFVTEWPSTLEVTVEEYSYFRGILHVEGYASCADQVIGTGFVGLDDELQKMTTLGGETETEAAAGEHHFVFGVAKNDHEVARETSLVIYLKSGRLIRIDQPALLALKSNPVGVIHDAFRTSVKSTVAARVLEIGSRARSGNTYRDWMPEDSTYTGFDVLDGENVDVVGDAHTLSKYFSGETFDAVFAISTFEHLAMPWVAAAEINRVLKPGGLVYLATHQTWPVHDAPWDFYRFSEFSWVTLFNAYSGFEIVSVAMAEPAQVVAKVANDATLGLELQPAFLSSAVLARKVADTDLHWDVDVASVVHDAYPM
ncbi:MAG: methyltransferase type 11 [Frankiales bacterium]|nr:methyltransferase type 11 [Frankiales bacterium]